MFATLQHRANYSDNAYWSGFRDLQLTINSSLYSSGWPRFRLRLRDFSFHPGFCSTVLRSREFDDICRAGDDNYQT